MPSVFYSAAKVRLQLRLETFGLDPVVDLPPTQLGPEGFGLGAEHPIGTAGFRSLGFDIVPTSCTVERNSYRKADACKLVISFAKLPIDPRIIRAMTVQVFAGTFTPSEYAAAMGPPDALGLSLPDHVPPGRLLAGYSNEVFRGFADSIKMTGNESATEIHIDARDATGIFLDEEVPPNALRDIPLDLPLDQVIQLLIFGDGIPDSPRRRGLPGARGMVVVNEATLALVFDEVTGEVFERAPMPTLGEIRPPQWADSKRMIKKGRRLTPNTGGKMTYWDLVTDLCVSAGFIVYIRTNVKPIATAQGLILPAAEIVISTPRNYYGQRAHPVFGTRKLIVGANVDEIELERKLGAQVVPGVDVRTFDPATGLQVSAQWPPIPLKKASRVTVSGTSDHAEYKTFVLNELSQLGNKVTQLPFVLLEAAKSIYQQLGRSEFSLSAKTRVLAGHEAFLEDGIEADLFQLTPGEPIEVSVKNTVMPGTDGVVSPLVVFNQLSIGDRSWYLAKCGIDPVSANAIATVSASPLLQRTFRTQQVILQWSENEGWDIDIQAINYLDIRNAVDLAFDDVVIT